MTLHVSGRPTAAIHATFVCDVRRFWRRFAHRLVRPHRVERTICFGLFTSQCPFYQERRTLRGSTQTRISPNVYKSPLPVRASKNPPLLWPSLKGKKSDYTWRCRCVSGDPRLKGEHSNFKYKGFGERSALLVPLAMHTLDCR
jgi:hypothetical protein